MRARIALTFFATLALTVGVATASAGHGNGGGGGNGGGKGNTLAAACKKGGWKTVYRSDGTAFKNQGKCVSYAVQGGTLATGCQPGSWSATGVTPCALADVGFYVDTVGATAQTPCPVGTTTVGPGSDNVADCTVVLPPI
jgi:Tyrosine-protein kinase ephrin type A/B receptor-like